MSTEFDITKFVFEKKFECPVCSIAFSAPIAKYGKSRVVSQDADLKQNYSPFDPIAYDVVVCPSCGYAESVDSFEKPVMDRIKANIIEVIRPKFCGHVYPMEITTEMALERFHIMIANSEVKNGKIGTRAYTYLKMAWVCRNAEDIRESIYLKMALDHFKEALQKEAPPIAGMDSNAVSYIIGELERRTGDDEAAIRWFSAIVASAGAEGRLKDRARNQKDLILQERKEKEAEAAKAATAKKKQAEGAADEQDEKKKKKFEWF
ncbi:MAG: DUF2225 domain-containing protein [Defluviitaleaceae bacterium]|nr:DUF2225 domain-containing protein [Defluviitaleaceae bacterium]